MINKTLEKRLINENIITATKIIESNGIPVFPLYSKFEDTDMYTNRISPVVEAINYAKETEYTDGLYKNYNSKKIAEQTNRREYRNLITTEYITKDTSISKAREYLQKQGIPLFPEPEVLDEWEDYTTRIDPIVKAINNAKSTNDLHYDSFILAAEILKRHNPEYSSQYDEILQIFK